MSTPTDAPRKRRRKRKAKAAAPHAAAPLRASGRGYAGSEATHKRRFSTNALAGDALSRTSAVALRNQARHLERNHDIARGILDKLTDFVIGPNGVMVEPQPRALNGHIHEELAERLEQAWQKWGEWPEVTWTHDRGAMERLAARTWLRDGEVFGQMVTGRRPDLEHGSDVPLSIELIEPDLLPHDLDDAARGLRQGIERNAWGRPRAYHFLTQHPGDLYSLATPRTVRRPAENVLHVRLCDRIGQLRGVSVFASIITTLQDLYEYEDSERVAAKLGANLVMKITRGSADMYDPRADRADDLNVYKTESGMTVLHTEVGEDSQLYDPKRPNPNTEGFVNGQLRRVAAGAGLSYSAVSRNYNGTYSAQRQELVENWPHYHALTGMFVAQWSRPAWQEFVKWFALTQPIPADVDRRTLTDAMFFGPAMPWIDPLKEVSAQVMQVQACFKSSASVMRERNTPMRETYRQIAAERRLRDELGIESSVELPMPSAGTSREQGQDERPEADATGEQTGALDAQMLTKADDYYRALLAAVSGHAISEPSE